MEREAQATLPATFLRIPLYSKTQPRPQQQLGTTHDKQDGDPNAYGVPYLV
jgi:hypothetical protein